MSLWASCEFLMSLYNIASLRDRVRPQGVYGDRKISTVHPVWVSFLCIDQIEASMSSRGQTPGYLSCWTCKSPPPPRGKIVQMPHPPNFFVKGKFDNPTLLLDQISAGKTWHFRFKLPTPARQRFKFPSPWVQTTIKCQWVSREMLRWRIVFNCF